MKDTTYPAILLTAGLNDGRVAPYNSFKFAALLQAEAAPGSPILLTVNSFGHGIGSSLDQQVADITDVFLVLCLRAGNRPRMRQEAGAEFRSQELQNTGTRSASKNPESNA